jgi:hypothetical protein
MAKGVVWSPAKKKKKKKGKMGFGLLGVAGSPSRAWKPPHTAGMGVAEATLGPWGWSSHHQNPKHIFYFFLFFVLLGVAGPPLGQK